MNKFWSRFIKTIVVLFVLISTGLIFATSYFFKTAFVRAPKSFITASKVVTKKNPLYPEEQWYLKLNKQEKQTWHLTATDGMELSATYIPAAAKSDRTILLAHGFMGTNNDMGKWAAMYHQIGFNVLMPDARAHGKSKGQYIGYGWPDRLDYTQWVKRVVQKNGADSRIVLAGVSMGGATVMMTAGEKLPSQVKAVIEDCGYTDLLGELKFQLHDMYHGVPEVPIINLVDGELAQKTGYNIADVSSINQLKKSNLPIMFIHGDADKFVPTWMGYKLYRSYHGPKKLYIAKGAKHGEAYKKDKKQYRTEVLNFLEPLGLTE